MAVIFYFSSKQKIAISESYLLSFLFFKSLHIVEYGVLFLLWRFTLYKNRRGREIAALISILYGVSDEFHQTFVPTREGRIRDVFIDALGIFIFWQFFLSKIENLIRSRRLLEKFLLEF
jgi:VanZ family protein